ncbi:ROK family protein [Nonomuraea sp. NPDC023979]|uniref:ROK family protein n=1 Tax=Nonomuraea sp. NPDC023979 TaxID=3154796 RepID=UPI0033F7FC21
MTANRPGDLSWDRGGEPGTRSEAPGVGSRASSGGGGALAVAVDIGGTKIAAGLVDAAGRLTGERRTPTPAADGGEAIMAAVLDCVRPLLALGGDRVVACGIATAGVVDAGGRISSATDLLTGWAGTDVRSIAGHALGLPVAVVNDCHAAGTAEARLGAARGARTALVVAVGTGIGGALVTGGTTYPGPTGTAGALGHLPAPASALVAGRKCSCGATDHIEAHASGPAIERTYHELTGRELTGDRLDLAAIAALARSGDPRATQVITTAATLLGRTLAGAANLLDPDVIVIAGGVSRLGPLLLDPLRLAYRADALPGPRRAPIHPAALTDQAGLIGAGLTALPPPS